MWALVERCGKSETERQRGWKRCREGGSLWEEEIVRGGGIRRGREGGREGGGEGG
jgi:hypothetical protein